MLNKFALVVLILQLARAEGRAAAQSGPQGLAMKDSNACSSALDTAGCATCTSDGQTCLTCKKEAQFISVNKKSCKAACDATGEIETPGANPKACKCNDGEGYTQQGDGTCAKGGCNTKNCKTCDNKGTDRETCTACTTSYYLTPTNQCISNCAALSGYYGATENEKKVCKRCEVANCEACNAQGQCQTCSNGFYKDGTGACQKCHESCRACSGEGATKCTECPAGKILKYSGVEGQCTEQCVVNTAVESGNCKTCGLTVEGTAYCSGCSKSDEYPQNGVCAPKTARAATCSDGTIQNGVCTACTAGYFRMNGGCYETTRYPGKSVCTQVASSGGTCQTAAPGYKLNNGNLVTCPEGCKTCSSSSSCDTCADGYVKIGNAQTCSKCHASCLTCETDATKCTACASGYYKTASAIGPCISCETDSGSVTGVKGCASCAAPSGSTGAVLCYLMKDSAAGGSDPNLSSGAIAGISVAVIVIVGGLVGFLCWWFICRGKA